jgi:hypothetical protein
MITKPFMLIAGSKDILTDSYGQFTGNIAISRLYDPVTGPYGLHEAPRYGVTIDGANHLTAVGRFHDLILPLTSWNVAPLWDFFLGLLDDGLLELMPEEEAFFDGGTFEAKLEDTINAMFKDTDMTQATEEARADQVQKYTLHFWDSYLSPRYDVIAGAGSQFLGAPEGVRRDDPYIYDARLSLRTMPAHL